MIWAPVRWAVHKFIKEVSIAIIDLHGLSVLRCCTELTYSWVNDGKKQCQIEGTSTGKEWTVLRKVDTKEKCDHSSNESVAMDD